MGTFDDLTSTGRGYVTRAQYLDSGYRDRDIRAAMRAGLIVRIRHGVYAESAAWKQLMPEQQHVVIARSVADKLGPGVALSHQSACATHGYAMHGHDLTRIHVTRLDGGTGRNDHGLVHHVGKVVSEDDIVEVDGLLVVEPGRAVWECATIGNVESAIVVMDSALHRGTVSREQLTTVADRLWNWQGARRARYALRLSDGRSESPGESRSRYLFRRKQLPSPDLQVDILDEDGRVVGRVDFAWIEYRHLGEFDGLIKFGGIAGDPRTPQEIAFAEKTREDDLRRQLLGMSRWTWHDLRPAQEDRTIARIRAGLEQSRRLYSANRVIIPLG